MMAPLCKRALPVQDFFTVSRRGASEWLSGGEEGTAAHGPLIVRAGYRSAQGN